MMENIDDLVLIADDEANILMLLELNLSVENFKSIRCDDGAKALAPSLELTPVLALLDWSMPIIALFDVCCVG